MTQLAIAIATLALIADVRTEPLRLKCTLGAGNDGGVQIRWESAHIIDADVHTSLVLEPSASQSPRPASGGYWAPVDLATGRRYGANQPRRLLLRSGRALVAQVSPAELFWDRQISSVWPSRKLHEAVPAGRCSLHLELEEVATTRRARCEVEVVSVC